MDATDLLMALAAIGAAFWFALSIVFNQFKE